MAEPKKDRIKKIKVPKEKKTRAAFRSNKSNTAKEIPGPQAIGASQDIEMKKRFVFPWKKEKQPDLSPLESGSVTVPDLLAPASVDFTSRDYVAVDGVYHAYLYITGYGYTTVVGNGWLNPLIEAGEDINVSFFIHRQPKDKILSSIAKTTMINRSRMRDVEDTRQDYEELDSAISSGMYLKDGMNRNGEDFYYMHTLIEVVAEDADTLEQRVSAMETLCTYDQDNKGWKVVPNALKGLVIADDDQFSLGVALISTWDDIPASDFLACGLQCIWCNAQGFGNAAGIPSFDGCPQEYGAGRERLGRGCVLGQRLYALASGG